MMRKLVLVMGLVTLLSGCSSVVTSFESGDPGLLPIPGGGRVMLLYSNPNQTDIPESTTASDIFEKTTSPYVAGGIGMMGIWAF